MASEKAMRFEKEMLAFVGKAKRAILEYVSDPEGRQQLQGAVNDMYERAHLEQRQLRRALAFMHEKQETGKDPEWSVRGGERDKADAEDDD